jgi:hypothetical protein
MPVSGALYSIVETSTLFLTLGLTGAQMVKFGFATILLILHLFCVNSTPISLCLSKIIFDYISGKLLYSERKDARAAPKLIRLLVALVILKGSGAALKAYRCIAKGVLKESCLLVVEPLLLSIDYLPL